MRSEPDSTGTKVACPRCGQVWLLRVELTAVNLRAIWCPECDALWPNGDDVGPPAEGGYGTKWFDRGTYLMERGVSRQGAEEFEVLGPFM